MDPLSIVVSTIALIQASRKAYDAIKKLPSVPDEIEAVGRKFPLVKETLLKAQECLELGGGLDASARSALEEPLKYCKLQAENLEQILQKIEQESKQSNGISVVTLYRKYIKNKGKAHRVEKLMAGILEALSIVVQNKILGAATEEQIEQIKKAIVELSEVECCVSNSESGNTQNNSGYAHGSQYNNKGGTHTYQNGFKSNYYGHIDKFQQVFEIQRETWRDIFPSLQKLDYEERKNRNPKRVEGTCNWFVDHPHYRAWVGSSTSTMLLVSANPGCGKSVLARYLVDAELTFNERRTVCYFFFKDDFEDQREASTALCCILHQLFCQRKSLVSDQIKEQIETHKVHLTGSLDKLWSLLLQASQNNQGHGEIICVLDALDECEEGGRQRLTDLFTEFYFKDKAVSRKANLKFLITCRPYDKVKHEFYKSLPHYPELPVIRLNHLEGESEEELAKISAEINVYIEHRVCRIQRYRQLGESEKKQLLEGLRERRNQTYLWVALILDLVEEDPGIDKVQIAKNLVASLPTLDDVYEKILGKSGQREMVEYLLHIVAGAARPLTLVEISLAIKVQAGDDAGLKDWYFQKAGFEKRIRELCGLFVTITDSKVYLLHQTGKEFLISQDGSTQSDEYQWRHSLNPRKSHLILFRICCWYLLSDTTARNCGHSTPNFDSSLGRTLPRCCGVRVLREYCSSNWAAHYRAANPKGVQDLDLVRRMCDIGSGRCQGWLQTYFDSRMERCPEGLTTLMITSYFGLEQMVKGQLRKIGCGVNVFARDKTYLRSALSWASENGHDAVVKQLLRRLGVRSFLDLIRYLWRGQCLSKILREPKLLYSKGAMIDFQIDRDRRTALSYAAHRGHLATVQRLVKAEARVDLRDFLELAPISWAMVSGQTAVVEWMRAETNAIIDDSAMKPAMFKSKLFDALRAGSYGPVSSLLDVIGNLNLDHADEEGETPLGIAVRNNDPALVRLLVSKGAQVNLKDKARMLGVKQWHRALGSSSEPAHVDLPRIHYSLSQLESPAPLSWAAYCGFETIAQILLDNNADVNLGSRGTSGWTPLLLAAAQGKVALVELLLGFGADVEAREANWGASPLHCAALSGSLDIVKMLFNVLGISINCETELGETPLHWAAERNHSRVASLLLSKGAYKHFRDKKGRTPLWTAANYASKDVAKVLIENGALIDACDSTEHNTPLLQLGRKLRESSESVSYSIMRWPAPGEAADFVDIRSIDDYEVIIQAARDSVRVGFEDNVKSSRKRIPEDCQTIASSLIAEGANVNHRNSKNETPLWSAVSAKSPEMVRLLIESGADITISNNIGTTPLELASEKGYHDICELLRNAPEMPNRDGNGPLLASPYGE